MGLIGQKVNDGDTQVINIDKPNAKPGLDMVLNNIQYFRRSDAQVIVSNDPSDCI